MPGRGFVGLFCSVGIACSRRDPDVLVAYRLILVTRGLYLLHVPVVVLLYVMVAVVIPFSGAWEADFPLILFHVVSDDTQINCMSGVAILLCLLDMLACGDRPS